MSINKVIYLRLRGLLIIVICIFIVLVARLAYLQVYQHDYYMFRAEKNRYAKLPIPAPRGGKLSIGTAIRLLPTSPVTGGSIWWIWIRIR